MSLDRDADVVVVGGGLAGLAAAIRLSERGREVVCVEPEPLRGGRVGESLDFAAPSALADLGFDPGWLVADGIGTWKTGVVAHTTWDDEITLTPPRWVEYRPLRAERVTLHLDRARFDEALFHAAEHAGVRFRRASVVDVTYDGERLKSVLTDKGAVLNAPWFIDASGRSRVFSRRLGIGFEAQGPKRMALWTRCKGTSSYAGTTIWVDTESGDLSWAWQIPINSERLSVGIVTGYDRFRSLRSEHLDIERMFRSELSRLTPRESSIPRSLTNPRVRSYQPGVMSTTTGANWLLTGEAACMADPLTSSGVTQALRHGREAADIILASRHQLPRKALADYHRRVTGVASTYNGTIEQLIYDSTVREALGNRAAAAAYVTVGFGVTAAYTRLKPTTRNRSRILVWLLGAFRLWTNAWTHLARHKKQGDRRRRQATGQAAVPRT